MRWFSVGLRVTALMAAALILRCGGLQGVDGLAQPLTSPSLVQKAANTSTSGTSLGVAFGSSVTSGDLLVVSVSSWPTAPVGTSITDSMGDAYSLAGAVKVSPGGTYTATYFAQAK
jgi:hypothetical protein